jgi:hypothetical protein
VLLAEGGDSESSAKDAFSNNTCDQNYIYTMINVGMEKVSATVGAR